MTKSIEKLHRLLHELAQATIKGKLSWEDTADDEEFRAVLKPGMVRIGRAWRFTTTVTVRDTLP